MKKILNSKIFKTWIIVLAWAILAFLMSAFYYFLKNIGLIWDNIGDDTWNTRKVIVGIVSLASFVLMIVSIVLVWNDKSEN